MKVNAGMDKPSRKKEGLSSNSEGLLETLPPAMADHFKRMERQRDFDRKAIALYQKVPDKG